MRSDASAPDPMQPLLDEVAWVHRLARDIVGDPDLADDLAQEVWLSWVGRAAEAPSSPRAWFAGALRNLLRRERRGAARRQGRELEAAQDEAQPSAFGALARVTEIRRVADAVVSLNEPYRDAVLGRYFDGLTPTELAARDGVPVGTVKTRLKRGLGMLRERLDEAHSGDGRAWAFALAPLAFDGARRTTTISRVGLAIAALLVAGAATVAWRALRSDPAGRQPGVESAVAATTTADVDVLEPRGSSARRPALVDGEDREAARGRTSASSEGRARADAGATELVRGSVSDLSGRPVAGVRVRLETFTEGRPAVDESLTAVSAADGQFEFRDPPPSGYVLADDPRWSTLMRGTAMTGFDGIHADVTVAPACTIDGVVVDSEGLPLPGATVALDLPVLVPENGLRGNFTTPVVHRATTVHDGGFVLRNVPGVPAALLSVELDGYESASVELPAFDAEAGRTLRVDPIVLRSAGRDERALADASEAPTTGELFLEGHVVDEEGRALSGVQVWLTNRTPSNFTGWHDEALEQMEAERENALFRPFVYTDDAGAFRIDGLDADDYGVMALDVGTLLHDRVDPVPAGTSGIRLVLDGREVHERVSGRVVDTSGEPVAGVAVLVATRAFEGTPATTLLTLRSAPRTTEDGRFELLDLPGGGLFFIVQGQGVLPTRFGTATSGWAGASSRAADDLEIVVERRARLHVTFDVPGAVDGMRLLDAAGNALGWTSRDSALALHTRPSLDVPVTDGESPQLFVPLRTATIVFLAGERELWRSDVELHPDEPNALRF